MAEIKKRTPPFIKFLTYGIEFISYNSARTEFFVRDIQNAYHMRQMAIAHDVKIEPWMTDRMVAGNLGDTESEYIARICAGCWSEYD